MRLTDGRGVRSGKWYANEIFRADDINALSDINYGNLASALALLVPQDGDTVFRGLELVHSTARTYTLKAGAAISFTGLYYVADVWGFVAGAGDLFTVYVPEDTSIAFDAGGASDRIDILEIRPTRTDYDSKSRQYKDPVTGFISSALTNTKTNVEFEFQIIKGTALAKEDFTWTINSATVGSDLAGKYVLFNTHLGAYYVWFNTGSSTDPAVVGRIGIEVSIGSGDTYGTLATKMGTALSNALGDILKTGEISFGSAGTGQVRVIVQKYENVTNATNGNTTTYFDAITITTQGNGAPTHTAGWIKLAEVFVPASASTLTQKNSYDTDESGAWNCEPLVTTRLTLNLSNQVRSVDSLSLSSPVGYGFGALSKLTSFTNSGYNWSGTYSNRCFTSRIGGEYKKFLSVWNSGSTGVGAITDFSKSYEGYSNGPWSIIGSGNAGWPAILTSSIFAIPFISASNCGAYRATPSGLHPTTLSVGSSYVAEAVAGLIGTQQAHNLDGTNFIMAYCTLAGQTRAVIGYENAGALAFGTPVNVGGAGSDYPEVCVLDSTHAFVAKQNSGGGYIATISGTSISLGTFYAYNSTAGTGPVRIRALDSKHMIAYWYSSGGATLQYCMGTIDSGYTTVTWGSEYAVEFTNTKSQYVGLAVINAGSVFGGVMFNKGNYRRFTVDPSTYVVTLESEIASPLPTGAINVAPEFDTNNKCMLFVTYADASGVPKSVWFCPISFFGLSKGTYAVNELGYVVSKGMIPVNVSDGPFPYPGLTVTMRRDASIGLPKTGWDTLTLGLSGNRGSVILS